MSEQQPPSGPSNPPPGPPSGPPPIADEPAGAGEPSGKGRKYGLIGGSVVAVAAVAVAAVIVVPRVFGSDAAGLGAAEQVPSTAIAYAGVDLREETIEPAVQMLLDFPLIADQLSESGVDLTSGDPREKLFDAITEGDAEECGLTWSDDIEPWLGDQAAVAGVPGEDDESAVTPLIVLQSTDDGAAEDAFDKVVECGDGDAGAFQVNDGWLVMAEDQTALDAVVKDAGSANLADDSDFTTQTDQIGEPGILTVYAAPEAIDVFLEASGAMAGADDSAIDPEELEDLGVDPGSVSGMGSDSMPDFLTDLCPGLADPAAGTEMSKEQMESFDGAALTLRFADGAAEIEGAVTATDTSGVGTEAGSLVGTLPSDTTAAIGLSAEEGWTDQALTGLESVCGDGFDADQFLTELSERSGLDLPDDLETLTGDAMALSVGSGISPMALSGGPQNLPAGIKIQGGDSAGVEDVVGKISDRIAAEAGSDLGLLETESEGDVTAIGPSDDYRSSLLEDGGLGGEATFENAVPNADGAAGVFYVNFNELDELVGMFLSEDELASFEALDGLGMSSTLDGDTTRSLVRLTTDK